MVEYYNNFFANENVPLSIRNICFDREIRKETVYGAPSQIHRPSIAFLPVITPPPPHTHTHTSGRDKSAHISPTCIKQLEQNHSIG